VGGFPLSSLDTAKLQSTLPDRTKQQLRLYQLDGASLACVSYHIGAILRMHRASNLMMISDKNPFFLYRLEEYFNNELFKTMPLNMA